MYTTPIAITLVALLAHLVQGFRLIVRPARVVITRQVVKEDYPPRRNTFEELIQAFIEAFPSVLKPPKEMDKTKVIDDPPKFIKVGRRQMMPLLINSNCPKPRAPSNY